jgi:cell division protein FtsI/penicillin-binding protein 2
MELAISLEDLFPSPPDCQQNPLSCSSSMQLVAPTSYQELITNSTSLFPNIAFKIGQKKLKYYFSQFGLLADPDLAINYSTNSLSDGHRRQLADFARISIGQDWAVNNLSLVSAYSVFANNGQRVRPTIIKNQEKAVQRVISNQTAQAITAILINNYQNTQEVGSKLATSYTFAGKGGTTYASKNQKTIISNFIGYPAETNPSFIVFVSLSFTQVPEESWGFMLTKKPFEEISEFIIKHYALKP